MKKTMARTTAVLLIAPLVLGGCATTGSTPNAPDDKSASSNFECNPAVIAGVGAVIGGLLGGGNNTLKGAAIGGAIGAFACMAINHHSEQVKSAQQVENEYKAAHRGQVPEQTTVVQYQTAFKPATIHAGTKAEMGSYIEVANGRNDPNPKLEEEMSLYKPDGSLIKTLRKPVSAQATAGGFNNRFQVPMPVGVPEGVYPVKTALYVNGSKVRTNSAKLQIVMETGLMRGTLVALQ